MKMFKLTICSLLITPAVGAVPFFGNSVHVRQEDIFVWVDLNACDRERHFKVRNIPLIMKEETWNEIDEASRPRGNSHLRVFVVTDNKDFSAEGVTAVSTFAQAAGEWENVSVLSSADQSAIWVGDLGYKIVPQRA